MPVKTQGRKKKNIACSTKPMGLTNEGQPSDKDVAFEKVGVLLPSVLIFQNLKWQHNTFYEELVRETAGDKITQEHLAFIFLSFGDRAHDQENELCVYWKMTKCGLQVTPAQLTVVTWCYISSFERMFEELRGKFGQLKPTLCLFANYFSFYKFSKYFISVKKKVRYKDHI